MSICDTHYIDCGTLGCREAGRPQHIRAKSIAWITTSGRFYHLYRDCPLLRRHQYRQYGGQQVPFNAELLTQRESCTYCERKQEGKEYFAVSNTV